MHYSSDSDMPDTPEQGRRRRVFGHGELRLVILDLLNGGASHGYELIKAIESLTQGFYTPSPGVIYPTLDYLQQRGMIVAADEESSRRAIAVTADGQRWLDDNHAQLNAILERVHARCAGHQLRQNPHMKRALANFKAVLSLRVNDGEMNPKQIKAIVAIIDRAALQIAALDSEDDAPDVEQ